jgi:S-adenosylmethionine:tRNA ribosyltransferase-isomerase
MNFTETALYSFDLPPELIATQPAPERSGSRLMVVDRASGTLTHTSFSQLPKFLTPDDLLVLNNSRVLPAAMQTVDGTLEILLVEETSPNHWTALVKPGKRAQPGMTLVFAARSGKPEDSVTAEVLKTLESGERVLRFLSPLDLEKVGHMPLPPYILKQREKRGEALEADADWTRYQTVYAERAGSVAAPTAGLHFTPELLAQFQHAFVTLHVGLGTFRPIKVADTRDHVMHSEKFWIPEGLQAKAQAAKRVVAVGTTTVRVLESVDSLRPHGGETKIFIQPPYTFRHVNALVTNFHLPHSTLLMLVCAFGGYELMMKAYREAVRERYRFFSFGDAMLIV